MLQKTGMFLLILLLSSSLSFAGGKEERLPYPVADLKNNTIPDTIPPSSIEVFFYRYILYRDSKAHGRCEILFETDSYVYYGYPLKNDNEIEVISWYLKISKDTLLEKLPSYKNLSMQYIDNIVLPCWDTVDTYYKNIPRANNWMRPEDCIKKHYTKLTDDYIEVYRLYKPKNIFLDFWVMSTYSYKILIDKKTLKIASTERIIDKGK